MNARGVEYLIFCDSGNVLSLAVYGEVGAKRQQI